jgi:hypothetical protein
MYTYIHIYIVLIYFYVHMYIHKCTHIYIYIGIVIFEAGSDSGVFEVNLINDLCYERYMKYLQLTLSVPGMLTLFLMPLAGLHL